MNFYNTATGKTVSQRQAGKDNPNTSFSLPLSDATLVSLGLTRLASDPKPAFDEDTQVVVEGPIEVRGGTAYQTYTVADRSADAIANDLANKKANIRAQRNARLTETDWAMMPDSPLIDYDKSVMADYRAALRDVPAQAGFPNNALPEGPDQRPYDSWTYDSAAFVWNAPLPKPASEAYWDEDAYQADNTTGWITIGG